jgi:hypothetical protein
VTKTVNQAYQKYINREGPSPNVDAIWRQYADVKSLADLQSITGPQSMRGVARVLSPDMEVKRKTEIYNLLVQKLAAMGGNPIPVQIINLLNITSRRKDFESRFVAKDMFSNTRKVGGQSDVNMPFYKDGRGNIKVSPNFASARYPEWHRFLNDLLTNTSLQVINKVFSNAA